MTDKPLTNNDIIAKTAKYDLHIRFVLYHELKGIRSIDEILPCILLYELHDQVGHWICLFRNQEGINYFDPTGRIPDTLLKTHFENSKGRKKMNADFTYLNRLLFNSNEKITYNSDKLQPDGSMTCGYWCSVRLIYSNIKNNEFNNEFMKLPTKKREQKIVKIYSSL